MLQESPAARILSEEAGIVGGDSSETVWIVDPLDGTRNFAEGVPFFCVSIGIMIEGVPEVGVIYDPIHDEMFSAIRGKGAFCNDEPIHVSEETSIDDGLISISWVRRKVDRGQYVNYVEKVSRHTSYFRRFGSAALAMAYVACGRTLAYLQGGLNPWDVAGGLVIVQEAGALITDLGGRPIDVLQPQIELLTANPSVHAAVLRDVVGSA